MDGPADAPLAGDLLAEALRHVGSTIRDLRRVHGLTQSQAATRAGLSQAGWSRVESGEGLRLADLLAIQHLFGVDSLESFLGAFPSRRLAERRDEALPAA